ncbi:hypothetical protein FZC74_19630 [Sutcliffiella horikoshii]|uniref:Uncharacterized protein n=1 Tax=Sutcliffiella horikoshii TaxID=79883 RepID=A0AA95B4A5_9BACI|nr:hypothetical protein [Sutcliffiella horikoshii]TYS54590.1 hypothetical protein FZC74_19630 [Sutcliffiella horikoshii]
MSKDKEKFRTYLFAFSLIVVFLFTSNVSTGFANQDLQFLLTGWFNKERDISISHLEKEISSEKKKQMGILKEEVAQKLNQADKELGEFTDNEIEVTKAALEQYTLELIESTEFNSEKKKRDFSQEVDKILNETMVKLEESKTNILNSKE